MSTGHDDGCFGRRAMFPPSSDDLTASNKQIKVVLRTGGHIDVQDASRHLPDIAACATTIDHTTAEKIDILRHELQNFCIVIVQFEVARMHVLKRN